jgi:hypothetical protein
MFMLLPSMKPVSFSPRAKAASPPGERIRGTAVQNTDHPSRLLRACRRHPRCRAAEKGDELAPSHGPSLTPRTTPYHIVGYPKGRKCKSYDLFRPSANSSTGPLKVISSSQTSTSRSSVRSWRRPGGECINLNFTDLDGATQLSLVPRMQGDPNGPTRRRTARNRRTSQEVEQIFAYRG